MFLCGFYFKNVFFYIFNVFYMFLMFFVLSNVVFLVFVKT